MAKSKSTIEIIVYQYDTNLIIRLWDTARAIREFKINGFVSHISKSTTKLKKQEFHPISSIFVIENKLKIKRNAGKMEFLIKKCVEIKNYQQRVVFHYLILTQADWYTWTFTR